MTGMPPTDPRRDDDETRPDARHESSEEGVTVNVPSQITEEIAVTEVPEDVARELEQLFSPSSNFPDGPQDDSVVVIDDFGNTSFHVEQENSISGVSTRIDVAQGITDHSAVAQIGVFTTHTDDQVVEIGGHTDDVVVIEDTDVDRIVIVDNDQPDPAFEERRRKRERREKLKKVRWFKWAAIAVVAVIAVIAVLASPVFSVRDVQVEGAIYTSSDAVQAAKDLLDGESYFTLETDKAVDILKQDPWVEDVRISKHFPSTAVIEIAERQPIVWYVGEDNKARVVDAEGRVIVVLEGWPTDYLQVKGVGPSLEAGAIADIGYRAAAQTVIALPDELERLVESLELGAGGELSMTLTSGTVVRFGSPTDLQNKLVSVVVLLRRQDPSEIAVIDVSTGEITVATR